MGSRTRSLQLKVMYCKDLRAFNFFQKLSVYAVVSILSDEEKLELLPQQRQRQKTPTDTEGDGNPEWNHEMRFDLGLGGHDDDDHLFLHFDLRYDLAVFGDKSLGEVRVPLKDLINEGESIVRFVNYEVRNSDGKPNGVLNFSYKVLNDAYNDGGGDGDGDSPMKNNINAHIHGYPIVNPINNHHQISDDDQSHKPFAADVNCSSLFPSSQVHYASPPPEEYLQIPSAQSQESYYPAVAAAPHHQVHYPSLETPYSTLAEVGYTDYPPPPVHQFHYLPPPPPPPRPPPPPPPPHHHPPHHHRRPPHHHHGGQGAVYHSPSPWLYEHPYPRPPDSLGGDYAYVPYGMHSTYNTGGDRPNHCWTVGGIP